MNPYKTYLIIFLASLLVIILNDNISPIIRKNIKYDDILLIIKGIPLQSENAVITLKSRKHIMIIKFIKNKYFIYNL